MFPPDYWAQHYQTNHTKIHDLDHFLFAKDLTNPGLKQAWQLKTYIVLCVFITVWFQKPNDGFDYFVRLRLRGKACECMLKWRQRKLSGEMVCGGNQIVFKTHQEWLNLRSSEIH